MTCKYKVDYTGRARKFGALTQPDENAISLLARDLAGTGIFAGKADDATPFRILDAGAGGGWTPLRLIRNWQTQSAIAKAGFALTAVDNEPDMLATMQANAQDLFPGKVRGLSINSITADIDTFLQTRAQGQSWDAILSCFLLQHVNDWRSVLGRMVSATAADGTVVLAEMGGDHALLAGRFNKDAPVADPDTEPDRYATQQIVRTYYNAMALNGFGDAGQAELSAADMDPAAAFLADQGLTESASPQAGFTKSVPFPDMLQALGLLQDHDGKPGLFSVALPKQGTDNYDIARDIRQRMEKSLRDHTGREGADAAGFNLVFRNSYRLRVFTP